MATNTATSFTDHTGNNTAGPFNISFNYLDQNEVDVIVDGALKTINAHYTFTTASTISFTNSNFPAQNAKIRFQRDTNISAKKVDFSDGSVLTESDLDLQNNQLLYGLQESIDTITHDYFQLDGSQCLTGNICFEGATTDDNETHFGVTDPTADQTYLLPNLGAGTYAIHTSGSPDIITNTHIASGTIIDDNVAANADIKGTKIEPEFGSQVIRQKVSGYGMNLYPNCLISMGMTNDISSGSTMTIGPSTSGLYDGNGNNYIDNNINLGHPNLGTPGGLGGYQNEVNQGGGSSGNGHRATVSIGRLSMQARKWNDATKSFGYVLRIDGRDGCMFYSPDNSSFNNYDDIPGGWLSTSPPSTSYTATVAQNMDRCRDAADFRIINGGAKANNKLEIGSATTTGTLSLSGKDITSIIINSAAVAHTANDASVFTTSGSDARYFRQDTSETITSGITWSGDDAHVATTGAIDARIVDLVDDVGGFVPIANETSFPNANPDVNNGAGTLLSVPLANNITSNGSGVISIANGTIGNSTVTINGAANNTTYSTGFGIIVETTSTLNTYTFHRYVPKATEVTTVAGISSDVTTVGGISTNVTTVAGISSNVTTIADAITNVNNVGGSIANVNTCGTNITSINNFADRYQIASSNPSTDGGGNALADGDLYFDTTNNLLKVYNGTAWQGGITATEDLLLKSGDQMTGNLTFSGSQTVDGRDVSVDGTKLDGIAANANNYSISSDLLDEDDMNTNSATKVASQQSIKAYVDTEIAGVPQGDITGVTAGNGLTGGGTSGAVTLTVVGGTGITANADDIAIDSTVTTLTGSQTLTNKTLTSAVLNTGVSGTAVLDEDNMASNSATQLASQQSIKAYVDTADALKASLSGATFTGDVIFDNATNAGNDMTWDMSENALQFNDNVKAIFGTDGTGPMELFHHSSNWNIIRNKSTGGLFIESKEDQTGIDILPDSSVKLRYSGGEKLSTKAAGVEITGQLINFTSGTAVLLGDNSQLELGSSNDLKIWHNADADSHIRNESGNLVIEANGAGDDAIKIVPDGAVELYYDGGTAKLATTASGVDVAHTGDARFYVKDTTNSETWGVRAYSGNTEVGTHTAHDWGIHRNNGQIAKVMDGKIRFLDSKEATFGGSDDLKIYHSGGTNYADIADGQQLYFRVNGANKFYVQSGGAQFVGSLYADNNNKIELGSNQDFKIYYSGSTNILECRNSKELHINNAEATNLAKFIPGGAAELYFDGTSAGKKLETYASGAKVYGTLRVDAAEGAVAQLLLFADEADDNADLWLQKAGTDGYFSIQNKASGNWENSIRALGGGSVELYHDNEPKLKTYSGGVRIESFLKACSDSADSHWGENTNTWHQLQSNYADNVALIVENSADGTPYGMLIYFSDNTPDNNTQYFLSAADTVANRCRIYSDGDVWTSDAGTLTSDETLKENITDATSKLEDIKKLKVRNFNWKASFHPEKSKKKQIGFIAQEVEEVFPSLVNEYDISPDIEDKDHTPIMKKSIKAAWDPIIIKAMQELIEKVEVLETEVAALKGA